MPLEVQTNLHTFITLFPLCDFGLKFVFFVFKISPRLTQNSLSFVFLHLINNRLCFAQIRFYLLSFAFILELKKWQTRNLVIILSHLSSMSKQLEYSYNPKIILRSTTIQYVAQYPDTSV